jgi:ketosteroid isomerase-like protein
MKTNLILLFFSLGLFLSSCTETPQEQPKPDLAQLKTTLQAMEDAYAVAQNAKNADGVVVYYSDDAHSLSNNKPKVIGKKAILAETKSDMASDTTNNVTSFEVVDVFADGDLAVEVGKSVTKDANGKVVSTGKYISVFEKRDGKYVCVRDIWNDDAPSKPGE